MKEIDIKTIKNIQLAILKAVDKYCREHNIKYFLFYGTLLGAVRHKGYIPWDDDIDICMMRSDYNRFVREFNCKRTDNFKVLHYSLDPDFPYEFAKIEYTGTKVIENVRIRYEIGINIDCFVLDSVPDRSETIHKILKKSAFPILIFNLKNSLRIKGHKKSLIKRVGACILKMFGDCFPIHYCTAKLDSISQKYSNLDDKYVANVCQRWFKKSAVLPKQAFHKIEEIPFEGTMFCVPEGYDEILTALYGNYMQLPPVEERVTHHDYKAYIL